LLFFCVVEYKSEIQRKREIKLQKEAKQKAIDEYLSEIADKGAAKTL